MYGRADQPADAPGSPPRVTDPPPLRPPSEAVRRSSPSRLRPGHAARTDADLLRLARGGDPLAYEAIVARYREPLRRACARIVPDRAEDAVQQTLISAWLALERGAEVRELRPWLYSIARNAAIDQARGIRAELVDLGPEVAGGEDPADAAARRREVTDVLEAVAALPERQRSALVATALHGRATEAVAVDLGLSGGALRQLVHRARTNVRAAVPSLGFPIPAWLAELLGEEGARRGAVLLSSGSGAALLAKTTATVATVGAVIAGGVQLEPPAVGSGAAPPAARGTLTAQEQPDRAPVVATALMRSTPLVPVAATAPVVTVHPKESDAESRTPDAPESTDRGSSPNQRATGEPPTLTMSAAPARDHHDADGHPGRPDRDRTGRSPSGHDGREQQDAANEPTTDARGGDRRRGGGGHSHPSQGGTGSSTAQTATPSPEPATSPADPAPAAATAATQTTPASGAPSPSTPLAEPVATTDRDNSSVGPSTE